MANITVEVVGNSSGANQPNSNTQQQPNQNTPPSQNNNGVNSQSQQPNINQNVNQQSIGINSDNSSPYIPNTNRMVDDVRRAMRERGVVMVPGYSNANQFINQYGQNLRDNVNNRITNQYDERRADIRAKYGAKYEEIENNLEERRKKEIVTNNAQNDPAAIAKIDEGIDNTRQFLYKKYGLKQDKEEQQLAVEEEKERKTADNELSRAIKDLVDYFKREEKSTSNDSNSYIGQLRMQQRELIQKRDTSSTEEEAMSYSRQLSNVNDKLRTVLTGDKNGGSNVQDKMLQMSGGVGQILGGVQQGNLGQMIMGAGTSAVAMSGAKMGTAMKALGWIGAAVGVIDKLSDTAKDYEAMSSLAALRSPSEGWSGRNASRWLGANMSAMEYQGVGYADLGMNRTQFADEAARRTKQRGIGEDFFNETIRQIALEKNLGLSNGSLGQAGQYDRYGINSTDAISRLVTSLNSIKGSGVDYNDFTRVQEKFDIQQQIMSSYMNRSDRPDYNVANNAIAALSSVKGITQDSRLGSDYAQFQNAIQSPSNDRMRALIYGAVSDIMPETGGRMDLIDRAIRNPENEGKIMQAVMQRITQQFGGTDTQMGYFVMKNLFPNIAPDRLDAYMSQMSNPNALAGNILSNGMSNANKSIGDQNAISFTQQSVEFMTGYTKLLKEISESVKTITGKVATTTWNPGQGPTSGRQPINRR